MTGLSLLPDNILFSGSAKGIRFWNSSTGNEINKVTSFDKDLYSVVIGLGNRSRFVIITPIINDNNGQNIDIKHVVVKANGLAVACIIEPQEGPNANGT